LPHLAGGYNSSFAQNISDDGFTLVGFTDIVGTADSRSGWYWNAEDGTVEVPKLPGYLQCEIYDCSADGSVVVGGCRDSDASGLWMPILWSQATGTIGLLGASSTSTQIAYGVSADGTRVIGRHDASTTGGGFLWTQATGPIELEIPPDPTPAGFVCIPTCISGDGSLVGGQYSRTVLGVQTLPPAIWSGVDGSFIEVPTLPGGWAGSSGCINAFSYDGSLALGGSAAQYGGGSTVDLSRHGKTIVGRGMNAFLWDGATSTLISTTTSPTNRTFRRPVSGTVVKLNRTIDLQNIILTAGDGVVYASYAPQISNPSRSEAVRISMFA